MSDTADTTATSLPTSTDVPSSSTLTTLSTATSASSTSIDTVDTIATNSTLRPMRTAFAQPTSCTGQFSTTSFLYYNSTKFDYTHVTIAVSDTKNPQFTTCQPSGWATVIPFNRMVFSPGVCPQSWTAYHLSATTTGYETTTSSAFCCSSGFTFDGAFPYYTKSGSISHSYPTHGNVQTYYPEVISGYNGPACFRQVSVAAATSESAGPTPTPTVSFDMHLAYSVQWQNSDTKSMSPQPPPVPCTYALYSWETDQLLKTGDARYAGGEYGGVWLTTTATMTGTLSRGGSAVSTTTYVQAYDTFVPTTSNAPVNTDCPLVEGVGKGVDHSWDSLFYFLVIGIPLIFVALVSCCVFCCVRGRRRKRRERERQRAAVEREQHEQAIALSLKEVPPPPQQQDEQKVKIEPSVAHPVISDETK